MDVHVFLWLFPVIYLSLAFTIVAFCAGVGFAATEWRASQAVSRAPAKASALVGERRAA